MLKNQVQGCELEAPQCPESVARDAIVEFGLKALGWRGFKRLGWVEGLLERYPRLEPLADRASAFTGEDYVGAACRLRDDAEPADRELILRYFAGRLGLEELSCRMNGAGAAACDKRAAFFAIWRGLTMQVA